MTIKNEKTKGIQPDINTENPRNILRRIKDLNDFIEKIKKQLPSNLDQFSFYPNKTLNEEDFNININ